MAFEFLAMEETGELFLKIDSGRVIKVPLPRLTEHSIYEVLECGVPLAFSYDSCSGVYYVGNGKWFDFRGLDGKAEIRGDYFIMFSQSQEHCQIWDFKNLRTCTMELPDEIIGGDEPVIIERLNEDYIILQEGAYVDGPYPDGDGYEAFWSERGPKAQFPLHWDRWEYELPVTSYPG
jgi:hypothetical protein